MTAVEVSDYTAGRIGAIVEDALRRSGALGVHPTPLEAVRAHAALEIVESPDLRPEVLGAVWLEERTLFVVRSQSAPRRRFTEAHELIHALCPWHQAVLRLDTAAELFGPARHALEAEANAGAAMLIFQGSPFTAETAALPTSLASVRALAERYGASLHATLRHYVQSHPRPVAMLSVGRFPRRDGSLPVWHRLESPGARAAGPLAGTLDRQGLATGSELRELVEAARRSTEPPVASIVRQGRRLRAEAHYNRHAFLVLLALERRTGHAPVRPAAGCPGPRLLSAHR
jgi:hypothetical protein